MAGFSQYNQEKYDPEVEIMPVGYVKNETGIYKEVTKTAQGKSSVFQIPISLTPFRVVKAFSNADTGEIFYEFEFLNKRVVVSGHDIAQKKGSMILAGHGLLTVEKYAKDFSEYVMLTLQVSPVPVSRIYDCMGWKDDGTYVLGKTRISDKGTEVISFNGTGKQTDAIHEKGTVSGWVKTIEKMLNHDIQRFKVYNAVVPPLLRVLNESNYSINDYGETSTGKTITTMVAMSIYGDPYDLLLSGNTTQVGIERAAARFCDMPINLDDIQTIDSKIINNIVYMFANGVGKVRGAKTGGLQEILTWRSVGLFTGEIPIISNSSFVGMEARLIEMYGGLKAQDHDAVATFESNVSNHHGVFAPILIRYIIENEANIIKTHLKSKEQIKNAVESVQQDDSNKANLASRLSNVFATILTAGHVFEKLYGDIGGEQRDPEQIVRSIFSSLIQNKINESYAERGLNHIVSWIASNRSNFLIDGIRSTRGDETSISEQKYKIFGNISEYYYDLLPSELKKELKQSDFNTDRLFKEFSVLGILETDTKRYGKTIRLEGTILKVYRLKRLKVDTLIDLK